jgi:Skp family chaperone for outer membrane proteins
MRNKNIKLLLLSFFIFNFYTQSSLSQTYPVYNNFSKIVVLNQEDLFENSEWGLVVLNNVKKRVNNLSLQNRSIEKQLEAEELTLTKIRKIKSKNEFDKLSFEFDEKVNNIRLSQAQKQLDINTYLNENRILFFKEVTPILLDLIKDLGVEVVLNKDTVAVATLGSDITELALIKINERLNLDKIINK